MTRQFGPGVLVAAAFIGPGTVTACTLAGANFGFALVWTLAFATLATIVLQDMAARLGAGAKLGLGEALMQNIPSAALKWAIGVLIFAALFVGNSAYEGGNLAGGALGVDALLNGASPGQSVLVAVLALIAGTAVVIGRYELLERILVALVLIMSAAFIVSFFVVRPDLTAFLGGLIPRLPDSGTLTAIALIGTTVVPYNLFLHAASARRKWPDGNSVAAARSESAISIGLGGLVSIFILSTAAASLFQSGLEIANAADMARAIEPAFGEFARYLIGIGLLAAGLTSAITAPMATAFALSEIVGGHADRKAMLFRITALCVVVVGAVINLLGIKPITLILAAQYANGLLLPIVTGFLLFVMNKKSLLGQYANSTLANIAGGAVLLFTLAIGMRSILRAAGVFP